jgi:hypothetical protein
MRRSMSLPRQSVGAGIDLHWIRIGTGVLLGGMFGVDAIGVAVGTEDEVGNGSDGKGTLVLVGGGGTVSTGVLVWQTVG